MKKVLFAVLGVATLMMSCSKDDLEPIVKCEKEIIRDTIFLDPPIVPEPTYAYCSGEMDSIKYWLEECVLRDTLILGEEKQDFFVKLNTSDLRKSYGFSVSTYGGGFPDYSIRGRLSSGATSGIQFFDFYFNQNYLRPGVYKGVIFFRLNTLGYEKPREEIDIRFNIELVVLEKRE